MVAFYIAFNTGVKLANNWIKQYTVLIINLLLKSLRRFNGHVLEFRAQTFRICSRRHSKALLKYYMNNCIFVIIYADFGIAKLETIKTDFKIFFRGFNRIFNDGYRVMRFLNFSAVYVQMFQIYVCSKFTWETANIVERASKLLISPIDFN